MHYGLLLDPTAQAPQELPDHFDATTTQPPVVNRHRGLHVMTLLRQLRRYFSHSRSR